MKTVCTLLALLAGTLAVAQPTTYRNVNTSINDNGNDKLSIQIQADRADGEQLRYNRTFNVAGLTKAQKDALKNHVLDSLGLGNTPPPQVTLTPPTPPTVGVSAGSPASAAGTETVRLVCPSCTDQMKLEISGTGYAYSRSQRSDREKAAFFPIDLPLEPGEYRLKYWQNGVLQMQTPFTVKAGAKNVITVK
ncbi:hypothetical protein [Fibrella arboris]|uniref:hypothetical protein n=1 Tax=Fibrella arboris TaxID=3242486 RepID=UPI003522FBEC